MYAPDRQAVVTFDADIPSVGPKHFLTSENNISIGGTTTANAQIQIRAAGRPVASAASDAQGRFRVNVPLTSEQGRFQIAITTASGFSSNDDFAVTVDRAAPKIALDEPPARLTSAGDLSLKGRTKPGAKLILDNREIANRNGRFEETIKLKPGVNTIVLTANDAAGNSHTERWQVQLDQDAPVLVRSRVMPLAGSDRPVLVVEVVADDASGLAKVAPFKITAGGQVLSGHLRYNKAAKNYQGTLVVPAAALQQAALSEVELEDDAGNKKIFELK
jgi:hypothetical protein